MPLSQRFDPLFSKYGGNIPVAFLRALAERESGMNPSSGGGSYWGLLQVGYKNVLPDFNKRHGTSYTPQDLFNPDINVQMAVGTLKRIVASYKNFHPNTPNMKENWSNPEFVKLVLAGWNSGYSEAGGVGRVARYLEGKGIPVTHDNVFKYSQSAGATKHLANDAKRRWQAGVANLFYAEGGPGMLAGLGGGGVLLPLALAVGVGYALYRWWLKR